VESSLVRKEEKRYSRILMRSSKIQAALIFTVILLVCPEVPPAANAQTLSLEKTWGGTGYDAARGVAVASSGSVYVAGYTDSFGAGGRDVVLLRYSSIGVLQWQRTWGGTSNDYGFGIAVDSSGSSVYVAGTTFSFGAGDRDVVLLKYSSTGLLQWEKTWGGASIDEGHDVAVDSSSGSIYVVGYTDGSGAGGFDVVLLKFDSTGVLQWQRTWGDTNGDYGLGVAVDSSGSIYVAGYTNSFGAGSFDFVLLKFDSTGILQWETTWGDTGNDHGYGIAVDPSESSVYVTGTTSSFGAGRYDVVLLKFDSTGDLQWQRTWGDTNDDHAWDVAVASGSVYVSGSTLSFTLGYDAVLLKFDSTGDLQSQRTWGDTNDDHGWGIAVDSSGNQYFAGSTANALRTLTVVSASVGIPTFTTRTPTFTAATPTFTAGTPTGTVGTPSGSEAYAGSSDAFLLKFSPPVSATVDFDPDTLSLKRKAKWVTVFVELPEGYDVGEISIGSIRLQVGGGTQLPVAAGAPSTIGDYDGDNIPDLMVKFDGSQVQRLFPTTGYYTIVITGTVAGVPFIGTDTIRVTK